MRNADKHILNPRLISARTIGVDIEKESQSPVRRTLVVMGGASESLYSNGNNLSRSESSSSDSVNSQDGNIQVGNFYLCWNLKYFVIILSLQFKRSGSLVAWSGQGPPPVPTKPEMIKNINNKKRQDELEQRHQELLARQRQLQVRIFCSQQTLTNQPRPQYLLLPHTAAEDKWCKVW